MARVGNRSIVRAALTSAVRFHARDYRVASVPLHGEADALIRVLHYSCSCPNTSTYRHGLYAVADDFFAPLRGVALWIPPTKTAAQAIAGDDWQGVLSLSRFVIAPEIPTNGASYLLGRSMRLIDRSRWPVLVTYADTNQGHTGAIYKATNWREDGPVPAGDTWRTPDGQLVGRKRGAFTRTAGAMRGMGYVKQPSRPKIRFVHDARRAVAA
jgi:hypothetical protein